MEIEKGLVSRDKRSDLAIDGVWTLLGKRGPFTMQRRGKFIF